MSALVVCLLLLLAARARASLFGDLHSLLRDCPRDDAAAAAADQVPVLAMSRCARRRALLAIDRILEDDRVPLVQGLAFVRRDLDRNNNSDNGTSNLRDLLKRIHEREADGGGGGREAKEDWRGGLIKRLARVLKTHVIKIDLGRVSTTSGIVEGRGRRRRRRQMQMMPIIMMGVLLMGSVLIPMGFQFLAVLGGKALILAKMALMLSSIQGLKKIATNGVNYGLYHSPIPPVAEPWHERSTASVDLPSYALSYSHTGGAHSYAPAVSSNYIDAPGHLSTYITNRRSAAD